MKTLCIVQTKLGTDGKPGILEIPGISRIRVTPTHLLGLSGWGAILFATPVGEVALAVIERRKEVRQ